MTAAFRELAAADAPCVAALRDRVLATLPHPDDYVPHAEEDAFLRAHFGDAGVCLGIELDARLVGFSLLTYDVARAHLDAALCDAIGGVETACVLAVTMLEPGARGMGLHRGAIDRRLAMARGRGRDRAVAIAAPSNTSSLCNLLRRGGRVEGLVDLPGGRVRYLIGFADDRRPTTTAVAGRFRVADPEVLRPLLRRHHVGDAIELVDGEAYLRLVTAAPANGGPR